MVWIRDCFIEIQFKKRGRSWQVYQRAGLILGKSSSVLAQHQQEICCERLVTFSFPFRLDLSRAFVAGLHLGAEGGGCICCSLHSSMQRHVKIKTDLITLISMISLQRAARDVAKMLCGSVRWRNNKR